MAGVDLAWRKNFHVEPRWQNTQEALHPYAQSVRGSEDDVARSLQRLHEPQGMTVCRGELLIADYRTFVAFVKLRARGPQTINAVRFTFMMETCYPVSDSAGMHGYGPMTSKRVTSPPKQVSQWAILAGDPRGGGATGTHLWLSSWCQSLLQATVAHRPKPGWDHRISP